MRIMITGGAGFIGSNLANKFLELGHEVMIYDFQLDDQFLRQDHPGMTLIQGDVLNLGGLTENLQKTGTDIVVHLAALRNLESQQRPFQAHSVNSTGMVNVLEAARLVGVKRVVCLFSRCLRFGRLLSVFELGSVLCKRVDAAQSLQRLWCH